MKKKPSLKDIALKVGVSTALVSYVLNGKNTERISKEVAKKIKDAARKLNYRPNHIAKSLKTNRTNTIGLIVADIANPFSSSLARIIEDEAEKNNYTVIFGSSDESSVKAEKLTDILLGHQVDGLIIAPAENTESQIKRLQKQGIPLVLIDRYFPGLKVNFVAIDNFKASYEAVCYLMDAGYRRIGIIGFNTGLLHLQDRQNGYTAAFRDRGLPLSESWIHQVAIDQTTGEEVQSAVHKLISLPEPVEAIFFSSNKISTEALKYLNTLPLKVPKDLAVLSFDQSDAAELFYASLTHIWQPLEELGQRAVNILLASISGNKELIQVKLDTRLVVGKSTRANKSGSRVARS
jgi:LacI family transcriptional regulator